MDPTQLARIEAVDRSNAFELGFFTAAQDAGLTHEQYEQIRKVAADVQAASAPAGAARSFAQGVAQGPFAFARPSQLPASAINRGARAAGVAARTAIDPASALAGGTAMLTQALMSTRVDEPDSVWGENVNPYLNDDFKRRLEQEQRRLQRR